AFLGPAAWDAWQARWPAADDAGDPRPALRFLTCWIAVYLVFFSLARTKLPNYVLPLYPPIALLMGRFLERWRRGAAELPTWLMRFSRACLVLMGAGRAAGLLVAGGTLDVPGLDGPRLPGLEDWAVLGFVPVAGAVAAGWCLHRRQRGGAVAACAGAAVA